MYWRGFLSFNATYSSQTSGCTNILYYTFLQLLVAFSLCALHLIITLFYFNLISIFYFYFFIFLSQLDKILL